MDGNPMGAARVPGVKRAAYCAPSGTHYQKAVPLELWSSQKLSVCKCVCVCVNESQKKKKLHIDEAIEVLLSVHNGSLEIF